MSALLGYPDGFPLNSGQMYPDAVAGLYGFAALTTALMHRQRTGRGQFIDLSMQEANFTFIGDAWLEYVVNGHVRERLGNRHMTFAPHGIFPTREEDFWIAIAAETESEWQHLCRVAGQPGWSTDPRPTACSTRRLVDQEPYPAISAVTTIRCSSSTVGKRTFGSSK